MTRAKFTTGLLVVVGLAFFVWMSGVFEQVQYMVADIYFHEGFLFDCITWLGIIFVIILFCYVLLRIYFLRKDQEFQQRLPLIEITYNAWMDARRKSIANLNRYQRGDMTRDEFRKQDKAIQQEINEAYNDWVWAGDPKHQSPEADQYLKEKYS